MSSVSDNWLGWALLAAALVPLGFLIYTLTHLDGLGIPVTHPRVVVEAVIFIGLCVAGAWVLLG